jgi:uncharacterized membrane-anchored protein YhcB (DUF1043 family)
MTKREIAIAAVAVILGVLMDRMLKNFEPEQFAAQAGVQFDIPDDILEQVTDEVTKFFKDVDPVWLNLKL